jgi:enolase-phosphatase E1
MLWQRGYQESAFKGHVYPDAADYLQRWHDRGLRLFVYSSGSAKAQKLIFGFSEAGDLTPFFSGYFDTRVGAKKEPKAYKTILNELGIEAGTVLFLSDVVAELEAAESVGMKTVLLVRDGDKPESIRPVAADFAEVDALLRAR